MRFDSRTILPTLLATLLLAASAAAVATPAAAPDSLDAAGVLDPLPQGAATSYMVGNALLSEGDLAGAVPFLAQAYRMSPDVLEFAETYRDVLRQLGYLRDAADVADRIVRRHPELFEAWESRIDVSVAQEKYGEALQLLKSCRAVHPDSLQLEMYEAEILLRAHDWEQALAAFRRALPHHPDQAERIYGAMAEIASVLGREDEAADIWTEGLSQLPRSRPLRLGKIQHLVAGSEDARAMRVAATGDSLANARGDAPSWVSMTAGMIAQAGRDSTAIEQLSSLADAGGLDLDATLLLGRLCARREDWGRAVAVGRHAVAQWPAAPMPRLFLGEFLAGRGDLAEGEKEIRGALALAPRNSDILLSLISVLSRRHPGALTAGAADTTGRAEIRDLADRAARGLGDPPGANAAMMLGATYQGLGDADRAAGFFERAADDPQVRREALLNLSLAYEQSGRRDSAASVLETLLTEHPDDPVVQNALGYTLADMDRDLKRAERLIRAAIKQDPDNPAYLDSLGWVLHRAGRSQDAFDYLVRATNALPEDPLILEHLGMVLLDLGRQDRAYEVFLRARDAGGDTETLRSVLEELRPREP